METFLKEDHCPFCRYKVDTASEAFNDPHRPKEGDCSMCLNCGAICVFGKDLRLRRPTPQEADAIRGNPKILQMQLVRAGIGMPDLRLPH